MTNSTMFENSMFDCSCIGFVPLGPRFSSISDVENPNPEMLLETCIKSVIEGRVSQKFSDLLKENIVKPFVRLNNIRSTLIISKIFLSFNLGKSNDDEDLLGRYPTSSISVFCPFLKNDTHYIAIHTSSNYLSEFHVIKLDSRETLENVMNSLEICRNSAENCESFENLKSVQNFKFHTKMTPFFHSCISEKQWTFLLRNPGDFLFRDSRKGIIKNIVLSYRDENGEILHFVCKDDPFMVLVNFQVKESVLKNPIMKIREF